MTMPNLQQSWSPSSSQSLQRRLLRISRCSFGAIQQFQRATPQRLGSRMSNLLKLAARPRRRGTTVETPVVLLVIRIFSWKTLPSSKWHGLQGMASTNLNSHVYTNSQGFYQAYYFLDKYTAQPLAAKQHKVTYKWAPG